MKTRKKFEIPEDFFVFEGERSEDWPDTPEVRKAVAWLRKSLPEEEWSKRRLAAAHRLYDLTINGAEPGTDGRFFERQDTFAWYLFLAEAYIDHIWNYDPVYGARVVPVFMALGRNLEHLARIDGVEERVRRMIGAERAQPNGPLFELLVGAAYSRAGGKVSFVPERRGGGRTHDMDVDIGGRGYAIECKRMETSEFAEGERARVRTLWMPSASFLQSIKCSTFAKVDFLVPILDVPETYLSEKTQRWRATPRRPYVWDDRISRGSMGQLDLAPLRTVLKENFVLTNSNRMYELLTGRYRRHQSSVVSMRVKPGENPRYADDCDYATLLEWNPLAEASILGRARDVLRKVADANNQLPTDRSGVVHVGFEAVDGDDIEAVRHQRIVTSMREFDPGLKPLEYVYTHFLAPESPPDQSWAYDETADTHPIRPLGAPPLDQPFLVLPYDSTYRLGGHWQ